MALFFINSLYRTIVNSSLLNTFNCIIYATTVSFSFIHCLPYLSPTLNIQNFRNLGSHTALLNLNKMKTPSITHQKRSPKSDKSYAENLIKVGSANWEIIAFKHIGTYTHTYRSRYYVFEIESLFFEVS